MFRNKEIRQFTFLLIIIAIFTTNIGFSIHPMAGILSLCSACFYSISFFIFTKARYKHIAMISEKVDHILHNEELCYISESEEGELSILQNEITKMTTRIQVQNKTLKKEKQHLADSLADIAHQLRTPLTSANLILPLLENTSDKSKRKILLREMEELFIQMDWLLTSLLKLSRLDASIIHFQKQPVLLDHLLYAAIHPFQIPMELHDITLSLIVPKQVMISCDENWLSEAIQNILKNCIETIGEHGQIEITCEDTLLFTEISIHDNGLGFKKEDLPHVFDRFYRGKNTNTAGYGIGLALCKMIILRQGGTITAKNHPKKGAVFSIRFPK